MRYNRQVLFGASALVLAAMAMPAIAQDAPAPAAAEEENVVEEVVVTGSRIRRDPTTAPTPLIALGREEIMQSGEPHIVDFLADVPALSGSIVPEDTTGSNLNDGGLSLLNLRDLGAVRTLVLVDGRRHVGSSPGTLSVDVDTIPSMLVESVEIVTGGQSALYGADAVSGVVNFILRKDFEGIEVDGSIAEINQDGQQSKRLSVLAGHNFFDDRLNVYAYAEHQEFDEVLDFDIDYRRESWGLTANDADPAASPDDGDMDTILLSGRRDANFARGGLLILANQPQPTMTSDPDVANLACGTTSALTPNCWNVGNHVPGNKVYVFEADGSARFFNYGTLQPQTGFSRRINVGGDGLNAGTEFGQNTRVPRSDNDRFQVGLNFNLTDDIQVFAEAKHAKEETYDEGQPTFFQITLRNAASSLTGSSTFNLNYNDLAYLDPAVKAAIAGNMRPTYASPTAGADAVQTGSVLDQRALLGMFGPSRSQLNNRELTRYVAGIRGEAEKFLFANNLSWELGYTYGEMKNSNKERGLDSERFYYAADAVVDTMNVTGKGAGAIVCRAQIQTAGGGTLPDVVGHNNGNPLTASHPAIAGCTPISLFGTDFRADANNPHATGGGGRDGLTAEQAAYLLAEIEVTDQNRQHDFLGFVSGELWDLWGAGPLGVALGYEYRKEETEGTGRDRDRAGRLLFLNSGPDFPTASYDVDELFAEVRLPLFTDIEYLGSAEVSGAYRTSDYSTVGDVETWSLTGQYKPNNNFFLRATYGTATRIPNLGENFRPATQTFGNSLTDPCSPDRIRANAANLSAADRDKLRANCLATMPAGYDPGTDVAGTGSPVAINYGSGIPGFNSGNPDLKPETSRSYTIGGAFTPEFLPDFSFTADYYDIRIDDVINTVSIQQAMNQCVGLQTGTVGDVNPGACSTFERTGVPVIAQQPAYGIHTFIQGSLNYAATLAKGVDFTARYSLDLADIFDKDLGRVIWSLRGNYLIRQVDYVNIANPAQASHFDSTAGLPRVRFLSTLTYRPTSKLSFSWDWDWQASQELIDRDSFATNPDNRDLKFYETGDFSQHDFSVRWSATDDITLRAGVVNAFDAEPATWLGSTTSQDNFDLFGRRMYVGVNYRY